MIIHSVYFWFRAEAEPSLREGMLPALRGLAAIGSVRRLAAGRPADVPPRSVLDSSYDFALVIEVADAAALAAYQADPLHQAFLERFSEAWEKVWVMDVEV